MERAKISTITEVWKMVIPTLMFDFKGFKPSIKEVTVDVVQTARESELEGETKYVT